jgi:signal transduction histidine kinase
VEGDSVKAVGTMNDHFGEWDGDDPGSRDRRAHDRHDRVIQQLFATGLGLQAALPRIPDPEVRERVAQSVVTLDRIIHEMRATMTELRSCR